MSGLWSSDLFNKISSFISLDTPLYKYIMNDRNLVQNYIKDIKKTYWSCDLLEQKASSLCKITDVS